MQDRKNKLPKCNLPLKNQIGVGISIISIIIISIVFIVSFGDRREINAAQNIVIETCRDVAPFKQRLLCVMKKLEERKNKDQVKPFYTVTLLRPIPDGSECEVRDINEKNQVTGVCKNANGHLRAVVWDGKRVNTLRLPHNELSNGTAGNAINEHGNVVGQSQLRFQRIIHAVSYVNGQGFAFKPFEQEGDSMLTGINDNNLMSGWAANKIIDVEDIEEGIDEVKLVDHGFIWDGRIVTDLGAYDDFASSHANDVNNRGQVVGDSEVEIQNDEYFDRAVLWTEDTREMIIIDQRQTLAEESWAFAINDHEPAQVVGQTMVCNNGPCPAHGFFWEEDGPMIDLGTYPGCLISSAKDVNNEGIIVGNSYGHPCSDDVQNYKAVVWVFDDDGTLVIADLNQLIGASDWRLSYLEGINDAGFIVGKGYYKGQRNVFLLTPNQNQNGD